LKTYFYLIQIIISVALIVIITVQAKGGGLGGIFGGGGEVYKTRRGFERTLYNVTIGLTVVFFVVSLLSVLVTQ
jgi:preprotein translocase subunit SecG